MELVTPTDKELCSGPTCVHCTQLGKGGAVRFATLSWALRLNGGSSGQGGDAEGRMVRLSWATKIPPIHLPSLPGVPAFPILGLDLRPPLFEHPGPSAMVSASLLLLMAQIKSTFFPFRIWENPGFPLSSPAPESHPGGGGGLQSGPMATFWAAASLPALLRPFPQTHSLPFAFSLTSPPWSPSSQPSSSFPSLFQTWPASFPPPLSIQRPQVPGAPPPLPLVLLSWVSPPLAPPILPAPSPPHHHLPA